jgi:hypothetical protein
MSQLALDSPKHKNGNTRHGRPDERKLAADLRTWLGELDSTEALRREQLREIGKLRSEVYGLARKRGLTPTMLRAARSLLRK